jgi:hypothetical protein
MKEPEGARCRRGGATTRALLVTYGVPRKKRGGDWGEGGVSPRGSRGGRRALQMTRVGEVARMQAIAGATRRCVPVAGHPRCPAEGVQIQNVRN